MGANVERVTFMTKDQLGTYFDIAGRASWAHVQGKGLPGHMREDLTQEGLLWLLEHPDRVEHATYGVGKDRKIYGSHLVAEIRRHYISSGADRAPGKRDSEAGEGTQYTEAMVALALPAVYDPEYVPFREQSEAAERFSERDPSESGTWFAIVADISRAIDAFGPLSPDIRIVFRHDVLNETFESIGASLGTSDYPIRKQYHETMQWLVDWLNGVDRAELIVDSVQD